MNGDPDSRRVKRRVRLCGYVRHDLVWAKPRYQRGRDLIDVVTVSNYDPFL